MTVVPRLKLHRVQIYELLFVEKLAYDTVNDVTHAPSPFDTLNRNITKQKRTRTSTSRILAINPVKKTAFAAPPLLLGLSLTSPFPLGPRQDPSQFQSRNIRVARFAFLATSLPYSCRAVSGRGAVWVASMLVWLAWEQWLPGRPCQKVWPAL